MARPWPVRANAFDNKVKKPVTDAIHIRQSTQKKEEQWRIDRQKLLAHYEQLKIRQQQLGTQRHVLEEKNQAARQRIEQKQRQLANIEEMQAEIIPMIQDQIKALGCYLDTDIPYLLDERRKRLERLEEIYADPEVAVSEKFRKAMEALLIEAEYGNTIEVYQETITVDDREMLVHIFRLGRIALYYQTLDQKKCGFFNVAKSSWQPLPAANNRAIQTAMDIGAKRRPAEIVTLPLGRMRVQ
jgi:hypothetical protein